MSDTFRDGVWFVDLAPISDPTRVVPTIAHTLGLRESAGMTIDEVLPEFLREKELLLVLDNFEQVIDAAPAVKGLLATAPRVSVLITSRALLRIAGEREYAVPLLGVPDTHGVSSPELLITYEAARLFIERAQAVKADFTVTAENAPAVAAICVWLEGLPLAIELAAARVRVLPPQKLLLLLQRRLQVLSSSARDLPARHQTLRAAIGWSYDLLRPAPHWGANIVPAARRIRGRRAARSDRRDL